MPYPEFTTLRVGLEGGCAFVTIDNPPVNLLDAGLMTDLDGFVAEAERDDSLRVIVFQSADPEFFIAHGDMNFILDPDALAGVRIGGNADETLNPMQRLHERIRALPQITIGKLAGLARGGGAEFLEALDMRFAARETAGLAQMEVTTGIMPGAGATAYLPRLIGRARALEVIAGAGLFDADTAERYGWINRALPADQLDTFILDLSRRMVALPANVIASVKTALDATGSIADALLVQNEQLGELAKSPEAAELNQTALAHGAQTRRGERDLERLLRN